MTRIFSKISVASLSLAMAFTAGAAVAEPEFFACQITKTDRFFTEEMVFALDTVDGSAMVVDPMILYYNDSRGREAEITEVTNKKTVFNWTMPMTNSSGQTTMMKFRGVLQRPSMRLLLKAQPAGYSNVFTGRGSCQPTEVEIEGF